MMDDLAVDNADKIMQTLQECVKRLEMPANKKRLKDKLRSVVRRRQFVNVDEPVETKTIRLCFPLIAELLIQTCQDILFADDRSPVDMEVKTIKFLYDVKVLCAQKEETAKLISQLQKIILPILKMNEESAL